MSDPSFERDFARARELLDLGRTPQAIETLLRLLRDHPAHQAPTLMLLALAHQAEGRRDEALATIRQSLALQPDAPVTHHVHASLLREARRPDDALASADEAIRLLPEWSNPHQLRSQILSDRRRHREAFDAANEAVRLDPEDADAHFSMGYVTHETNPATARQAYQTALQIDPQHTGALHNLGALNVAAGQYDAGVRGMADVLAASPQTRLPVLMLDQLLVELIQRWHLITFVGLWGLLVAGGLGASLTTSPPWGQAGIMLVYLLGWAAVLALPARRRLGPIRANLPHGGSRFLRGFARRERIATVWLCLVLLVWVGALLGLVTDVVLLTLNPEAPVQVLRLLPAAGIPLLFIGAVLSWIRVPLARRRIERDRLM